MDKIKDLIDIGCEVEVITRKECFNLLYETKPMYFEIIEKYENGAKGASVIDGRSVTFLYKYITKIDGMDIKRFTELRKAENGRDL